MPSSFEEITLRGHECEPILTTSGRVYGWLAIHRSLTVSTEEGTLAADGHRWAVTHILTGARVFDFPYRSQALAFIKAIGLDSRWRSSDHKQVAETMRDDARFAREEAIAV